MKITLTKALMCLGAVLMVRMYCQTVSTLAGTSWHPTTIWTENPPMHPLELMVHHSVTMYFDHDGEIHGTAAGNGYFGGYITLGNKLLIISGLGHTLMGCNELRLTIEAAYLSALQRVTSYSVDGEAQNLVMFDFWGNKMISFTSCEPVGLINTPWASGAAIHSTSWNVGKEVTMQLGKDNMVRGKTLCGQDYEIPYILDGGNITFQVENWPSVQCERADFEHDFQYESSMNFDKQFPEVLGEARSFEIDECIDRLITHDKDGMLLLSFGAKDIGSRNGGAGENNGEEEAGGLLSSSMSL